MLVLALHDQGLRAAALRAVRGAGLAAYGCELVEPLARADALPPALRDGRAHAALVVHDFAPRPELSVAWLDALTRALGTRAVFALLTSPATPALHALASLPHRFVVVDIAIARELPATALARRLLAARDGADHAAAADTLAAVWPLDVVLHALARRALSDADAAPPAHERHAAAWPTLERLLHETGVARRTFVHHARRAGFEPPLRFLQVVRVLGVGTSLHRGETAATAAARFGYGSPDTLRQHFAALVGLTPREARRLAPVELVERMRAREWPPTPRGSARGTTEGRDAASGGRRRSGAHRARFGRLR